ncbi:hemin transporter, partial [Streptomyces lunaelactis]|nr:hemin transporter [Streptomyces lunaelactis]
SITVKRVHGGGSPEGEVSRHLHAEVGAGDRLRVSAPYGDLVLDSADAPLPLASAGIGCTPMLSMLEHLAATGHRAPVTVVHGDRSPADHAMRTDHALLTGKLPDAIAHFWYETPEPGHPADRTGRVDLS